MSPSPRSIPFRRLPDFCAMFVPAIWSSNKQFPHQSRPFLQSSNATFRLFCHKILKTTQISTPCVLLALLYIRRLRSAYPAIHASIGSEVRLFTTALILANKFLDDNTYTNKTWSDVSGIPVGELNIMEIEFLSALDYTVYVHHSQFFAWIAQCQSYRHTSSSMAIPSAATTTTATATAAATATATAILTPSKSVKRSAAAMSAPYQRFSSKRRHHQKHHVPHTPPDETSHRMPPRIVTNKIHLQHPTPHLLYCSPEKRVSPNSSASGFDWCQSSMMHQHQHQHHHQQQQQQLVLSWSSSSSALASSRHTATPPTFVPYAASGCSPSSAAVVSVPVLPLSVTSAVTMVPTSLLTSRIRCLEIE